MGQHTTCSRFHRAVELIGGRWTGPILEAVLSGHHRYAEIKARVPGLSDTMLSHRLRALENEGLIERRVVGTSSTKVEYHATAMGRSLGPVLDAVAAWAHEWMPADEGSRASVPA